MSEKELSPGQLVQISIKNKLIFGVVVGFSESQNQDTNQIKAIEKIYSIKFSVEFLNLLKAFSRNTFNSINTVFAAFIQPFNILGKKGSSQALNAENGNDLFIPLNKEKQETFVEIDANLLLRIIYLIRSDILHKPLQTPKTRQILVVFPEKKLLDKTLQFAEEEFKNEKALQILTYNGDQTSKSKKTVLEIISSKDNITQIVFATRSGLFLPFKNLSDLILVDEANSFYIQEQNSLYFDARELAFLISSTFNTRLHFLSTLPSSRLYNFYLNKLSDSNLSTNSINKEKPLKIQITERNYKIDDFELFSDAVEQILTGEVDDISDVVIE